MNLTGIGVAGCGRMGAPMLAALRSAGFDATGFDVRPPADFGDLTPHMRTLEGFRNDLRILITVVRDITQTDDVLFGAQNLIHTAPNLQTVIVSSTLSPKYVRALRDRVPDHITLIDAPMSGAAIAAEEARLSFMLGGDTDALKQHQPLFDAMGAHFHHMGNYGAGMQVKVLNNLLAASNTAMTRLVLDWADQAGIDEDALLNLIHTSSGQNWLASGFTNIEFARDGWDADNTIGILTKDVASALDAAPDDADTTLPETVRQAIFALKPRP
ncbi:NAD(P)-dependent oxidoreductase [Shimia sagamensis]|uniref:3-hydroxyisobutyrate dehydrogenase n=1 Tax=Shimia sagamensis TaxID=1566352 RepID=A0ABY1P4U9_9RHOB|nr:NAD(P)-binding domain-containing protein [Shimia sagamensis]SMP26304.1 3-hydroxyisobutyrate dehydrogenase [Shimia sagamensis]